jgi:hypothetical protein
MQNTDNIRIETRIQEEIEKLLSIAEGYSFSSEAAHQIEKGLFKQLLQLGKTLLAYIFRSRINQLKGQCTPQAGGVSMRYKGDEPRQYLSLFGLLEIKRPSYWSKSLGKVHPTDGELSLPLSSKWSYTLEELVGEMAAECDYQESVVVINKLLDLDLSGKSSSRNSEHIGKEVEDYYANKTVSPSLSAVCFSASFDGKGVPKIKLKTADTVADNPKKRLGKGEKKGLMEMATVSVTSSFTPKKRSVDSIISSLMGSPLSKMLPSKALPDEVKLKPEDAQRQDNKWHKDIHRRAFLADQHKAVVYGLNWIKSRLVNAESRFVVPIDAGIGLEEKVLAWVKENNMDKQFDGIILDIIHVSEYVWDAATAIFGEKSPSKSTWVTDVLTDLLNSKTSKVIEDLKQMKTQTDLSESKLKQVEKTITYFTNHQHKMDYKTFIEKGYPVSSALVEAACGHLVKERMEQSGMRWSSKGAQNIMDIRAVKLNDDMTDFMKFRIKKEQQHALRYAA